MARIWKIRSWLYKQARSLWAWCYRKGRWVFNHLVQILALVALVFLIKELHGSLTGNFQTPGEDPSRNHIYHLYLLGLILIAAVLTQARGSILSRLKKVGPVEFVEERYAALVPELTEVPEFDLEGSRPPLPQELHLEYHKADRYLTHLEWAEPEDKMPRTDRFYDLLHKTSAVALWKGEWANAADRLELLLRISDGKFKPAVSHFRCGHAYRYGAKESQGATRREKDIFHKRLTTAADHFRRAAKENPLFAAAYFWLAYVQVDLKSYDQAVDNNEKAINCRSDYAPAKYNQAICHVFREDLEAAIMSLRRIKPGDSGLRKLTRDSYTDTEIAPLLRDPKHGTEAKRILMRPA